jgi:hypothetical protein
LAVDLDFSTSRLRGDLETQPLSHDWRVRCASGADEKNESREGHRNSSEKWEDPIHGSCLIRNGSGSSRILFAKAKQDRAAEGYRRPVTGGRWQAFSAVKRLSGSAEFASHK